MTRAAALASRRARRSVQVVLGSLWIFDGVLQAQPSLSTANYLGMMLRMGTAEPPGWLWDLESRIEPFVTSHAWGCNVACAAIQLAVGFGICWRRTTRAALGASVAWAFIVWLFGEAAGGLFSPGASALSGAPGAALIYALVAMVVWPPQREDASNRRTARRVPDIAWCILWLGTAALELEVLNRSGFIVGATISNVAYSAPGVFAGADRAVSVFATGHGLLFAVLLAGVQIVIALGIWFPRARRPTLALALMAAAFFGVVGQNLGGIFSNGFTGGLESGATDPGSGPILVLFALALWPGVRPAPAALPAPVEQHFTLMVRVRRRVIAVVGLLPDRTVEELSPDMPQGDSLPTTLVSV